MLCGFTLGHPIVVEACNLRRETFSVAKYIFACLYVINSAQCAEPHFTRLTIADVVEFLPPPPFAESLEATTESDLLLTLQHSRTAEDVKRAQSENKLTPAAFQPVLGRDFSDENFPLIFHLLADAADDAKYFASQAKIHFARPRPSVRETRLKPVIEPEKDFSYPSSHATRGILWALILCEVAPDRKEALLKRGQEIGWDRVIAGGHYPSDVFAGQVLGQALAHSMLKNDQFRGRLEQAQRELKTLNSAAAPAVPITDSRAPH
jgi:acid phosphatase (class A)